MLVTCQICAKTVALTRHGNVRKHGYKHDPHERKFGCRGSNKPPFELSHDILDEEIKAMQDYLAYQIRTNSTDIHHMDGTRQRTARLEKLRASWVQKIITPPQK